MRREFWMYATAVVVLSTMTFLTGSVLAAKALFDVQHNRISVGTMPSDMWLWAFATAVTFVAVLIFFGFAAQEFAKSVKEW